MFSGSSFYEGRIRDAILMDPKYPRGRVVLDKMMSNLFTLEYGNSVLEGMEDIKNSEEFLYCFGELMNFDRVHGNIIRKSDGKIVKNGTSYGGYSMRICYM